MTTVDTSVAGTADTREPICAPRQPWWLNKPTGNWMYSTGEIAAALEVLAAAIRRGGDVPMPRISLTVDIQVTRPDAGDWVQRAVAERIDAVDLLALAVGEREPTLSEEIGHYRTEDGCGLSIYSKVQEPATEEPERTLTSVEREIEELADEFGRTPYIAPEGGEYEQEPLHVHGVMFREGLGFLAEDPECGGCCEAAAVKWKQAYQRTQQERVCVDADSDAARLVSAVLTPDAPVTDAERNSAAFDAEPAEDGGPR